ncbi:sodium:solute symporter family transporter [Streptomyces cylindrosporus]|uniref:Transporter n=1 Tax=Streptomyces cylindrosporus TaxID=2927583 RepID=A0ABS9Y0B9_9ACTN|nr:transporter [Streptomyces cylindrosporus]MCI3270664.1 transporter [Streptomyces cylindrosporus]
MTLDFLSAGVFDQVGSDARRPVIMAFMVFVGATLLWLLMLAAVEEDTPEKLFVANRSLSPVFNGFAMAGEHISVLTLLGASGVVALFGYDGVTFAVDGLLTLGVMLILAQRIRNSGRYTLGDIFALRASGVRPRIAANLVTLVITIPVLLVQLRAAGVSVAFLIGLPSAEAQVLCTVLMGGLVTCLAVVGGLRGTSFIHVVKVPVTLAALAAVVFLTLGEFSWDPGRFLSAAIERSVAPDDYLAPGLWPYTEAFGPLNTLGNHIVVILGAAVLPQMILRVNASQTGRAARRSMSIAVGLVGAFVILLIAAGFAASAVVGGKSLYAVDVSGQSSFISLAAGVLDDGSAARVALITVVACVVFLAVLTTVASATFAAAVSLTHDASARGVTRQKGEHFGTRGREVRRVRRTAVFVGISGLSLSAVTHRYPMEFLATFSLSVAASCIFPALIYSFFWRRFNQRGMLWSVYGGLAICLILTAFSPTISGTAFALWPDVHFDWYPLQSPGIVSVPAAFVLGWLGSVTPPENPECDFRNIEYKSLTGKELTP